jgi:hypothetical protein
MQPTLSDRDERSWQSTDMGFDLESLRQFVGAKRVRRPTSTRRLYVVWILLLASLISWRSGTYYSGGLDPTVIAKALLSVLALALGIDAAVRANPRARLGHRTMTILAVYLVATLFGADASGSLLASTVLAIRLLIVAAAICCIMIAYPLADVIRIAMVSMVVVGLACVATGLGSLAQRQVSGTPVGPNDLARLFGPPAIWLTWRMVNGATRTITVVAVVGLIGLTVLTGSRTGLVALLVGVIIVLVSAPRLPVGGFLALMAVLPGLFYIVFMTGTLSHFAGRGTGTGGVTTLNSRTIAWSAAFSAPGDFWKHWFGGGLAVKTVAVSGTYWSTQVLDSSWVSAYVQGGIIGITVMGVYALTALVAALRAARPLRALLAALVVYALIRSGLENGLLDSYLLFVVMLIPSLASEVRSVQPPVDQPVARPAVDGLGWEGCTIPAMSARSSASSPSASTSPP